MRIQIAVRRPEVVTFIDAHSDNRTASVVEALKRVQRRRLAEAETITIGVRQAFPNAN
ncbi:hypothetical protein ACQPXH_02010 [Nocardia sp. CA-135953]|uniref:hypothetical protein n=1 Tax=Nocardia sp. CA-135953 TaxID=3239978 RepID=UPI003D97161B